MNGTDNNQLSPELIQELEELRSQVPQLKLISEEYKNAERLQAALYSITDLASSAQDMDCFYASLHKTIAELMYAENFYIAIYDASEEVVTFPYFIDSIDKTAPNLLPLEKIKRGLTAYVIRKGKAVLASNQEIADIVRQGEVDYLGEPPVSWLGVPLINQDSVTGAMVIQSYDERHTYTSKDADLLVFVAQHISTALERKKAVEELERRVAIRTHQLSEEVAERKRAERLQAALFRLSELTTSATDMPEFFAKVHAIVGELIYAENFYIALYDEVEDYLSFPYIVDKCSKDWTGRKATKGLTEYVLRRARPARLSHIDIEALIEKGEIVRRGASPLSWLGVPLIYLDRACGMLAVQSYTESISFIERDQELLTFVSHHIATALERKRANNALKAAHADLERRVEERTAELHQANSVLQHQIEERKRIELRLIHDALHDALTGLPNRNLFMDRLVQAMKRVGRNSGYHYAVLFLDLDRFKVINDSLGHMVGDELLKDVSRRVQACLRLSDTVARLGGDEFAILMESTIDIDEVKVVAMRIKQRLEEPFLLDGRQVFTSTSIGITMGHPRYTSPEELLRDSDAAMYRAKEGGRDRFVVFDESMHEQAMALLETQNDLRRAIERDEFDVHYQPFMSTRDHRIVGFEALARWMHPQKGMILPREFIPLAEEMGLITQLDWHILKQATTKMAQWLKEFPDFRPLMITANVSSKHFAHSDFVDHLEAILTESGLEPKYLKLEVREGTILDNLASVKQVLDRLEDLEVRLLLDDFGTRNSSISHLHRFPMEMIKVDRTFVSNMLEVTEHLAVVRTIKALATTLDMPVVAEGVETEAIYEKVAELGCEFVQGFFISSPLNADQVYEMLKGGGQMEF